MLFFSAVLKTIAEKYSEYVGDLLEPVRKQLAKEQYKLDSKHQLHPKTEIIVKMLAEILCNPGTKVIILVRRYFDCCYSTLEATLRCLKNAIVLKYPKEVAEERLIYDVISKANVVIAELSSELQFCPWRRISHVFEFEFRKESEWFQLCFDGNPNLKRFYAFDSVSEPCCIEQG